MQEALRGEGPDVLLDVDVERVVGVWSGPVVIARSWYRRAARSGAGLRVARLAEDALRDDVALHLARAAGNGQASGGEEALLPALRPAVEDGAVGAVERHAHLLHALLVLHAEQLAHARSAAGVHTRERAQGGAVPEQGHRLGLGDQVAETLLHAGGRRLAAFAAARQRPRQDFDTGAEGGACRHGDAFVGERGAADAPAVTRRADDGVVGDEDVVEEDLVEHGGAGELAQRPDVEPLGVHVDDEVGDAGVLGRVGIGAGQADTEVGDLRQRRPYLLAVEDPAPLHLVGPRAQRGQVGAGAGLAEELAPVERAVQRGPHPALLLLGRAVGDEGGQRPGPDRQVRPGHAGGGQLLVDDQLLERRGTPAPGRRPVRA